MAAIVNCPRHSNLGHQWLCANAWADAVGVTLQRLLAERGRRGRRENCEVEEGCWLKLGEDCFHLRLTKCYSDIWADDHIGIVQKHGNWKKNFPELTGKNCPSDLLVILLYLFAPRSLSWDSELGQQFWNLHQCHMWGPGSWDVL